MKLKQTLLALTLITFQFINAQELNPKNKPTSALNLKKQSSVNIITKTTVPQMGEMLITNNSDIKSSIAISAIDNTSGGTCEISITSVKMSAKQMGQEMEYNSEAPEEGDERMGVEVKKMMKDKTVINFDKDGIITKTSNKEKSLSSINNELTVGHALSYFLYLPKTANVNDTWEDTRDKQQKLTYTYKSYNNATGMATIECKGTIAIEEDMEQMGMQMHQSLSGDIQMTLTVDVKNLIIKKTVGTSTAKGNVDAMGQKMPLDMVTTTNEFTSY